MVSNINSNFRQVRNLLGDICVVDQESKDERARQRLHQEISRINTQITEYEANGLDANHLKNVRTILQAKQQIMLDNFISTLM